MTDIIQELRALIAKATPGPWAYRPREFDDWGFIRVAQADAEGWQPIVALGRAGPVESDHDEHRRNKTDPYGPNAELIVAAINHLPALLDRLEAAERGWQPIETAPRVKGEYFFCHLAWMQGDEFCTADGFGWNGRWFAAALFYRNAPLGECQHEMRQIEVTPTHWMQKPDTPAIREVKP